MQILPQGKRICATQNQTVPLFVSGRHQFFVNRGFGLQYATELGRWSHNGQPSELTQREQLQANKQSQLTLFDTPTDSAGYMEVYR